MDSKSSPALDFSKYLDVQKESTIVEKEIMFGKIETHR